MKRKLDQQLLDAMHKNPIYWKGPFYYNPKDPRLIVPKFNSFLGSTFNFASPYAFITVIALIAIILVFTIF